LYKRIFVGAGAIITLLLLVIATSPVAASAFSPAGANYAQTVNTGLDAPLVGSPTATPGPAVLVGHVTWQGRPAPPNGLNQLPLSLTLQNGSTTATYANQTTDASGVFTVSVGTLPNGVYSWWAKGPQSLATSGTVSLAGAASSLLDLGTQRTGDVNADNVVDTIDFTLQRNIFGKVCGDPNYNANADLNGDCVVDTLDFTLLRGNFGASGAPPLTPGPTSTATNSPTRTATTAPTNTATNTATNSPTSVATASATRTPTRTATTAPTNTATPTAQPGGPCPIFPADNIWNRNIAAVPTAVQSSAYMASWTALGTVPLHPDFGACCWQNQPIGFFYLTVSGQPLVPIHFTAYGSQSDQGPYPIPTNAPIQGGSGSTGDRHVLVVNNDTCILYEMYHSYPQPDGSWNADSGALWHLNSNALRPNGWTSSDAAGLPIYPSLIKYEEVQAGVIRHAMRFTINDIQNTWVWPARHGDGTTPDLNVAPMGTRLRLKASVDISSYSTQVRVILQGLKDYGMILADYDGDPQFGLGGVADDRWNNNTLHALENVHAADFEVVDDASLMVDPNSGQSR
jgi:hypothetical protein